MEECEILGECMTTATSGTGRAPPERTKRAVYAVASSGNGAAVTVMVTSLLKKCSDPKQDVRRHQADMPGGYSGRELDVRIVTPFLEAHGFSADWRTGWSDRSFDAKTPYDFDYSGDMGGGGVREALLSVLDAAERGKSSPRSLLTYTLKVLCDLREIEKVNLDRPSGLDADGALKILKRHFKCGGRARMRLPALAVCVAYREAAEKRLPGFAGATVGDPAEISTGDGTFWRVEAFEPKTARIREVAEILRETSIVPALVRLVRGKAGKLPARTYRLLAIAPAGDLKPTAREAELMGRTIGCQIVVGEALNAIERVLRALHGADGFAAKYAGMVEDDASIKYAHKMAWNNAVRTTLRL